MTLSLLVELETFTTFIAIAIARSKSWWKQTGF
jgi:hypothetical protein